MNESLLGGLTNRRSGRSQEWLQRLTTAKEWLKQNPPKNPPIIGIHCTRWPVHIEKCYKTRNEVAYATRVL